MSTFHRLGRVPAILLLCGLFACDSSTSASGLDAETERDGNGEAGEADVGAEAEVEGGRDADHFRGSGPITLVTEELGLTAERICDLDGDGREDNAIAEMGLPGSTLYVAAVNTSLLQGRVEAGGRNMIHIPWVESLSGPTDSEALIILFMGVDTDDPINPDDDFSGSEPFHVSFDDVDNCGEPLVVIPAVSIDEGQLNGTTTSYLSAFPELAISAGARLTGVVEPGGTAAELFLCAPTSIFDLGNQPGLNETGGLSLLETLLAGGAPFGLPVDGMEPDLDFDGDGLERFTLDAEGRIETCIDGDSTPIEGRDCWQDDRMADGFAITAFFSCAAASFAGFASGTEPRCEDPPEESVWDPR